VAGTDRVEPTAERFQLAANRRVALADAALHGGEARGLLDQLTASREQLRATHEPMDSWVEDHAEPPRSQTERGSAVPRTLRRGCDANLVA
jgi:hypothetical protein